MNIVAYIKKLGQSRSFVNKNLYSCYNCISQFRRFVINPSYRSAIVTRWKYKQDHYQGEIVTQANRYPLLFRKCAELLKDRETPSLLSFGCSTGEEVATIGKYLPQAKIMGVDINNWCLEQCRKKYNLPSFSFYHRISDEFALAGDFDAIFCMAVLQHTKNRKDGNETATAFTFEQFEQEIILLDQKLKPGGLFIIDNTDFSFVDTSVANNYKPLDFEQNRMLRKRPLFSKNNRKIAEETNLYRIFVKS